MTTALCWSTLPRQMHVGGARTSASSLVCGERASGRDSLLKKGPRNKWTNKCTVEQSQGHTLAKADAASLFFNHVVNSPFLSDSVLAMIYSRVHDVIILALANGNILLFDATQCLDDEGTQSMNSGVSSWEADRHCVSGMHPCSDALLMSLSLCVSFSSLIAPLNTSVLALSARHRVHLCSSLSVYFCLFCMSQPPPSPTHQTRLTLTVAEAAVEPCRPSLVLRTRPRGSS